MGKELNEVGEVLAVGPGKHTHSGEFLKTTIKEGDKSRSFILSSWFNVFGNPSRTYPYILQSTCIILWAIKAFIISSCIKSFFINASLTYSPISVSLQI